MSTSVVGGGDTVSAPDATDRINKLFPKCRPRPNNILTHQQDRLNSKIESREMNNVNYSSDDDFGQDNSDVNQAINNSKGYKLRDSRIIEIAGGRELYSQSRTKVNRKLRHSISHKHSLRNKNKINKEQITVADNYNQDKINNRIHGNEVTRTNSSKCQPSVLTNGDSSRYLVEQNKNNLQNDISLDSQNDNAPKCSPIAVVADGEVVVFDDITEDWKGLKLDIDGSEDDLDVGIQHTINNGRNYKSALKRNIIEENLKDDIQIGESNTVVWPEDKAITHTRVIGELPIAEYEGSPRRYGIGQMLPNKTPRPGFPQRVITEDMEPSLPTSSTFDYLYEFSETRKVLEEFFKCPTGNDNQILNTNSDDLVDFNELDYSLHRQMAADTTSENEEDIMSNDEKECSSIESPELELYEQKNLGPADNKISPPRRKTTSPLRRVVHSPIISRVVHSPVIRVTRSPMRRTSQQNSLKDVQNDKSLDYTPDERQSPERVDCSPEQSNSPDILRHSPVLSSEIRMDHSSNQTPEKSRMQMDKIRVSPDRVRVTPDCIKASPDHRVLRSPDVQVPRTPLGGGWYLNSRFKMTQERDIDSPPMHNHNNFLGLQTRAYSAASEWSGSVRDSSDADAELSDNNEAELNRVVKMPYVEDGLSSGHISDADNNNALPLLQNQSSLIVEDVVENGLSHDSHQLTNADLHSLDPLGSTNTPPPPAPADPTSQSLWMPRKRSTTPAGSAESLVRKPPSADDDEADTDLETDRLLGQQRTDDQGFYDDKGWRKPKSRTVMPSTRSPPQDITDDSLKDKDIKKKGKNKEGPHSSSVLIEGVLFRARYLGSTQLTCEGAPTKATRMLQAEEAVSRIKDCDVSVGGSVFHLNYLGSVEIDEDLTGRRRKKRSKKAMVEEAVNKIKAPEGENQPSTEVDLFISTEKIMVLNTELKEIMMDHALRTISYIADIGDLVVLMARRRFVPHEADSEPPTKINRTPKMICHVFESEEAQFIAQSIGQAFQVAYMEFLKANGIEDHSFVKEMDYQEVLNSQEIFGDELQMFAKKELQKEVVVPKAKGEILGVVVVESGWGSMLPTVVIANLAPSGAAARCGQLNIGDQIIAINGVSLVGLPLSTCQTYIKNSKNQTVVKLTVVPCPPVVEVKIKRPDTKYQLGFSVQNGVICSLLRGGIAERGGVRVGHRIIEINSQSVVAVPHERIVNLLATSVGEILMKTMPTSMFRLLTGQEIPVFI